MGRANRVIKRMYVLGWIDAMTYEKALSENPKVYDDTLTQNRAPFIVDEVTRLMKQKGIQDFKTGGYRVYTTIDLQLQKSARKSLRYAYNLSLERIEGYEEKARKRGQDEESIDTSRLNGAMVSVDSKSGDILALVGSIDYKQNSYNRATQGKRQPGSAFKPFIYQVAVDLGYSGATELVDIAKTYKYTKNGKELKWQPKNYSKNYKGLITLREALVHSSNLATINLVNEIGLRELLAEFKKFGIKNIPNDLSISLGTMSMSPLELAKYYTSFANHGIQVQTHLILYIEQDNNTIYKKEHKEKFITTEEQAFIMTSILKDVVRRGTGVRARVRGIELAGKTGTTNNNVDGWFAGYSPTTLTVVWFGNDNNLPMHKKETGGRISGPAFSTYYKDMLKLYPQIKRKFDMPENIVEVEINRRKEFFSDISKPPKQRNMEENEEELLF